MAQINPMTFTDANDNGVSVYELILTNWGNRGAARDANNGSIQYPPVRNIPAAPGSAALFPTGVAPIGNGGMDFLLPPIPSLSAIAISPRSDIDRCILNFPSLPQVPAEKSQVPYGILDVSNPNGGRSISIPQGFVEYGGILDTEQVLSVHAPLIGQLAGPVVVRAHYAHWFTDNFTPISGPSAFGTKLNTDFPAQRPWYNPELRLLLYLTGQGALPPTQRAPLFFDHQVLVAPGFPIIVVPVMGRRAIRVSTPLNSNGGPITIVVSGTFFETTDSLNAPANSQQEVSLGSMVVAVGATGTLNIDNPGVSYLVIRATAGVLASSRVFVEARD
jgi:hypothetical protein